MIGTVIKYENEIKIAVEVKPFGRLVIDPDEESKPLVNESHITSQVEGSLNKIMDKTPEGINFDHWVFHIDSFDES